MITKAHPTLYFFAISEDTSKRQYKLIDIGSILEYHRLAVPGIKEIFEKGVSLLDLKTYAKTSAFFTRSIVGIWDSSPIDKTTLPKRADNVLVPASDSNGLLDLLNKLSAKALEQSKATFPVIGNVSFLKMLEPFSFDVKIQVLTDLSMHEKLLPYTTDFSLPEETWFHCATTRRTLVDVPLYRFPVEEHYYCRNIPRLN